MEEYVNQRELGEWLGVSRALVARRWSGPDGSFPPDVQVGNVMGWTPQRVRDFGLAVGLITADGERVPRGPRERVLRISGLWAVDTTVLLSLTDIAQIWGRSGVEIMRLRKSRHFPRATARIGSGPHTVHGWTLNDVITYGKQTGKLDDAGEVVPSRSNSHP